MADDLTLHGVKKLSVVQLRKELEKRNLERSGCKSDLVRRLEDHLETANIAKAIAASLDEKTEEEESQSNVSGPSAVPLDESITNDIAVSALPALERSLEAESVGGEDDVLVSTTSKIADENSSALEKSDCIENSVPSCPKSADVITIDDSPENMSLEMIKNFTVVRLRQELGKRGLDKSGLKNDLVLRLETHFQECADGEKVEKISLETEPADEAQAKDSALPCDVQAPAMDSQLEIHTPVDEKSETVLEMQPHSEIKLPSETDPGEDIELCKKVETPETKSPEAIESPTDIETPLEDKYVTSQNVDLATEMEDSPEVKSITEIENPPEDGSTIEMENSPELESDTEMKVPLELESVESVEKTVDGENLQVESSVSNISDEESLAQERCKKAKYTENYVPPIHKSVEVMEDETETIPVETTSKTEAHSETNSSSKILTPEDSVPEIDTQAEVLSFSEIPTEQDIGSGKDIETPSEITVMEDPPEVKSVTESPSGSQSGTKAETPLKGESEKEVENPGNVESVTEMEIPVEAESELDAPPRLGSMTEKEAPYGVESVPEMETTPGVESVTEMEVPPATQSVTEIKTLQEIQSPRESESLNKVPEMEVEHDKQKSNATKTKSMGKLNSTPEQAGGGVEPEDKSASKHSVSLESLKKLTVIQLRNELDKLGLDKSGLKAQLIGRLEKYIQEQTELGKTSTVAADITTEKAASGEIKIQSNNEVLQEGLVVEEQTKTSQDTDSTSKSVVGEVLSEAPESLTTSQVNGVGNVQVVASSPDGNAEEAALFHDGDAEEATLCPDGNPEEATLCQDGNAEQATCQDGNAEQATCVDGNAEESTLSQDGNVKEVVSSSDKDVASRVKKKTKNYESDSSDSPSSCSSSDDEEDNCQHHLNNYLKQKHPQLFQEQPQATSDVILIKDNAELTLQAANATTAAAEPIDVEQVEAGETAEQQDVIEIANVSSKPPTIPTEEAPASADTGTADQSFAKTGAVDNTVIVVDDEDNQKSSEGPDVVILDPKPAKETEKSLTEKKKVSAAQKKPTTPISPINMPCLWVSDLDPKTNAQQLKDHFSGFGRVLVSKIVSHPKTPGVHYGVVIVLNNKIARSCVYKRNKSILQNKTIYVEQMRTTGPRKRTLIQKQQKAKKQQQAKQQPPVQHQGEKQQIQLQSQKNQHTNQQQCEKPQHTNQQQGEKQQLDTQQQPLKQKQEVQEQRKKAKTERELFLKRRREQEKQEELILQKKIRQKIEIDLQEKKQAEEKSRESSKQERESRVEREPKDGPIQEKKQAKEKSHESSKQERESRVVREPKDGPIQEKRQAKEKSHESSEQERESRVVREPKDGPKNDLPHSVTDPVKDSENKRELEQQECFIRELKRRNDEQKLQGKQKLEKLRRERDRLEDEYHRARKNKDRARSNILKDELDRKTLEYKIRKELEDEARSRYAKEERELKDRLDKERRDRVERELREKIAQEIREREESERAERAERERIETEKLDREVQELKKETERKRKLLESERYEKDWGEKLKGKSIVNRGLGVGSSEGDRLEEEYRQFTSSLSNTHSIVPERKRQSLDNTTVVQQHHQQHHQNRQALEPAERFSGSNQTRNRTDSTLGYQNSPQAYNTGNTQYSRTNNMNSNMNGTFYSGNNQALQDGNNENNQVLRDIAVRNGPLELTFDGRYKPASGQRPQRNTGFSCMK